VALWEHVLQALLHYGGGSCAESLIFSWFCFPHFFSQVSRLLGRNVCLFLAWEVFAFLSAHFWVQKDALLSIAHGLLCVEQDVKCVPKRKAGSGTCFFVIYLILLFLSERRKNRRSKTKQMPDKSMATSKILGPRPGKKDWIPSSIHATRRPTGIGYQYRLCKLS